MIKSVFISKIYNLDIYILTVQTILCVEYRMKFIIFLCFISFAVSRRVTTKYKITWTEGMRLCEDVSRNIINVDNMLVVKKGPEDITLSGSFEFLEDVPEGIKIIFLAWKKRNNEYEYVYRIKIPKPCDEIQKNDTFLAPLNKQMNISSCPIKKKVYKIDRLDVPTTPIASKNFLSMLTGVYKTRFEMYSKDEELLACVVAYNALEAVE